MKETAEAQDGHISNSKLSFHVASSNNQHHTPVESKNFDESNTSTKVESTHLRKSSISNTFNSGLWRLERYGRGTLQQDGMFLWSPAYGSETIAAESFNVRELLSVEIRTSKVTWGRTKTISETSLTGVRDDDSGRRNSNAKSSCMKEGIQLSEGPEVETGVIESKIGAVLNTYTRKDSSTNVENSMGLIVSDRAGEEYIKKVTSKSVTLPTSKLCPYQQFMFEATFVDTNISDDGTWKLKTLTFGCATKSKLLQWVRVFQAEISRQYTTHRPRRLLVLINPYGGRGKAADIYNKMVHPILRIGCQTKVDVTMTTHAGHAREIVQLTPDLGSMYDGVIVVGGDGMFNEVVNGLLTRQSPLPSFRIGLIPAGSTNCILYSTQGGDDVMTATLQVVLGRRMAIDVGSVWEGDKLRMYFASMCAYGFFGDVVHTSEKYRWMGPLRYDFSGFKTFLRKRVYGGKVFLKTAGKLRGQHGLCETNCTSCFVDMNETTAPHTTTTNGITRARPHRKQEDEAQGQWEVLEGDFLCVNATVISCKCAKSPNGMSPHAHLSDGCMDLIVVRNCNRAQYLAQLSCLANPTADHLSFDFVEFTKVTEFKFVPNTPDDKENNSEWVSDGEPLGTDTIHCKRFAQK
eukprot:CFRG6790T1